MQKNCYNDKKCQCRWVNDSLLWEFWIKTETTNACHFGLGPGVVIGLVKSLPKGNFSVFIDNYFNSIPLMKYSKQENIGCTSTVNASMPQDCSLLPKSEFKKQPKGNYQCYWEQNSGVETLICNNNGAMTVVSNCNSIQSLSNARRWSKEAKDYINVPSPAMIGYCNSSMGGTDQMDQLLLIAPLWGIVSGICNCTLAKCSPEKPARWRDLLVKKC